MYGASPTTAQRVVTPSPIQGEGSEKHPESNRFSHPESTDDRPSSTKYDKATDQSDEEYYHSASSTITQPRGVIGDVPHW